jgi:hypothetical protein
MIPIAKNMAVYMTGRLQRKFARRDGICQAMMSYWIALAFLANKAGHSVRCVKRNYALDIDFAMLIKKETKNILHFKDYENHLDSLLASKYETVLGWCIIMEKGGSELKEHYLGRNSKEDYFLQYYDERCIKPIISATNVEFKLKYLEHRPYAVQFYQTVYISAVKTAAGAAVKYSFHGETHEPEQLEIELDMEEWQDFVRVLYKYFETKQRNFERDNPCLGCNWELSIHYLDKETLKYFGGNAYPANWKELRKLLYDMDTKVKEKTGMEEIPWQWRK